MCFAIFLTRLPVGITCPKPPAPDNGGVSTGAFNSGETIAFTCDPGFRLVGSSVLLWYYRPPHSTQVNKVNSTFLEEEGRREESKESSRNNLKEEQNRIESTSLRSGRLLPHKQVGCYHTNSKGYKG